MLRYTDGRRPLIVFFLCDNSPYSDTAVTTVFTPCRPTAAVTAHYQTHSRLVTSHARRVNSNNSSGLSLYHCLFKGEGSPYSIAERRVPKLIPVLGSQPTAT